jgi:hypothetical protein
MSGDQTPLLAGVIPIFEIFITGWEKLKMKRPHLAPFIQPGLDSAGEYYSKTDKSKAYVVGMCTSIQFEYFLYLINYPQLSILRFG